MNRSLFHSTSLVRNSLGQDRTSSESGTIPSKRRAARNAVRLNKESLWKDGIEFRDSDVVKHKLIKLDLGFIDRAAALKLVTSLKLSAWMLVKMCIAGQGASSHYSYCLCSGVQNKMLDISCCFSQSKYHNSFKYQIWTKLILYKIRNVFDLH